MIKHTRYRETKQAKKRIDPLFVAVIAMLVFVPVINACSTTPNSGATRKTQINTDNIETNSLKLPDGYEWGGEEEDDDDDYDEDMTTSSFKKGTTMAFKADKNAPTSTRLNTIEDQLTLLREDFNELYPSMRRLMAIEQDMQELILELKSLTSDVAASAPAPRTGLSQTLTKEQALARANELKARAQQGDNAYAAPTIDLTKPPAVMPATINAPVTQAQPPVTAPAPAISSGPVSATVTGMRIGIHADIVRVVLDYTNGSNINYTKSMGAQSFTLNLPETTYEGRKNWHSEFVPMVTSYSVQQNGSNASIQFALESGVSLKSAFVIPPKSAAEKSRLVIDFSE